MSCETIGKMKDGMRQVPVSQLAYQKQWLSRQKDGVSVRCVMTVVHDKDKSWQQVKAHFGLVVSMIRDRMIELGFDICGVYPNREMVHDILKKACSGVGDNGECLGFSEMSTAQASRFFDNCRVWAATQLQLYIPDPDPNWRENDQNSYH